MVIIVTLHYSPELRNFPWGLTPIATNLAKVCKRKRCCLLNVAPSARGYAAETKHISPC